MDYAVVKDGVVIDVIVWEGGEPSDEVISLLPMDPVELKTYLQEVAADPERGPEAAQELRGQVEIHSYRHPSGGELVQLTGGAGIGWHWNGGEFSPPT